MDQACEYCESHLTVSEPANVALLAHIRESPDCAEQFNYMLENLRNSWTSSMSGG